MKRLFVFGILLVIAACGGDSTRPTARSLSPEKADHRVAGYSPDGSRIYWWQQEGDLWRLYVSPADMSAPKQLPLTSRGADNSPLVWSHDGSRFAIGVAVNTTFPVVWLMDTVGAEPRRLGTDEAFAQPLLWHPDGRRLSYVTLAKGSIVTMVVDVDSGTPRRLMPGESRPHIALWSPDATRLAVVILDQGHSTIWLADSTGGNMRQVTTDGFENLDGPSTPWSPDGSAVLYTSRRTGTSDIWVLPVDGSAPRQLTNDVRDDGSPRWSPDGRWIAFTSNRGLQDDVWIMPAAGGEARRATDDAAREELVGWRPGTAEVLYTVNRQTRSLWTHNLADGAERQLTHDSLDVPSFNVSSAGQVFAAIHRGGGVTDFSVLPLGGGEPRIVLRDARSGWANWSPDGSRLLFLSDRAGSNSHLWVMDSAGGDLRQLTQWPERDQNAVFSADGSAIYFVSQHQATFGDLWRVPVRGGDPARITSTGRVLGTCWQRYRPDEMILYTLADAPVTIASMRLRPGGSLQPVWDRSTAGCGAVSPTADSIAISVGAAGGGFQSMLLPLSGGPGRRLLEPNQGVGSFSPDGRQLTFVYSQQAPYDLGLLNLADGSTRRITNTPESEEGTEWSPDGSALVFTRVVPISRITTADVARLMAGRR
jgi:Tol biopolymer transport system component